MFSPKGKEPASASTTPQSSPLSPSALFRQSRTSVQSKLRAQAERAARKKKEKTDKLRHHENEKRQKDMSDRSKIWREDIFPFWSSIASKTDKEREKKTHELCWRGIPPNIREIAWPLLIGNHLEITPEVFNSLRIQVELSQLKNLQMDTALLSPKEKVELQQKKANSSFEDTDLFSPSEVISNNDIEGNDTWVEESTILSNSFSSPVCTPQSSRKRHDIEYLEKYGLLGNDSSSITLPSPLSLSPYGLKKSKSESCLLPNTIEGLPCSLFSCERFPSEAMGSTPDDQVSLLDGSLLDSFPNSSVVNSNNLVQHTLNKSQDATKSSPLSCDHCALDKSPKTLSKKKTRSHAWSYEYEDIPELLASLEVESQMIHSHSHSHLSNIGISATSDLPINSSSCVNDSINRVEMQPTKASDEITSLDPHSHTDNVIENESYSNGYTETNSSQLDNFQDDVLLPALDEIDGDVDMGRISQQRQPLVSTLGLTLNQPATVALIEFDLPRTFPQLGFFHNGGPLQAPLDLILQCFAHYRPEIGYVQGMSYLAAILLLNLNEFEAFLCLANLLSRRGSLDFFRLDKSSIDASVALFDYFFQQHLPLLFSHMRSQELSSEMYLMDWHLSLFSKTLPLDIVAHLWDVYLYEGEVFLLRAALAILRMYATRLCTMSLEEIMSFLVRLPDDISEEELFENIHQIRITPKKYEQLREKFCNVSSNKPTRRRSFLNRRKSAKDCVIS